MKKLFLNHKMNLLLKDIEGYVDKIPKDKDLVVFPSNIYIPLFTSENVPVGSQDVSASKRNNMTSEVSATQLKNSGAAYVLVGHSERRAIYQEESSQIRSKLENAVEAGLIPVLCIGEQSVETRYTDLKQQIKEAFGDSLISENIIIAYEPLFAIGSGQALSVEEIDEMIHWIKSYMKENYHHEPSIIYGGSVNDENIKELSLSIADGFLAGGASLEIEKVKRMIEALK